MPLQKTIGQARPEVVPSLIVMNAGGAVLDGGTLTLKDIAANAIVFADRPVRAAGALLAVSPLWTSVAVGLQFLYGRRRLTASR